MENIYMGKGRKMRADNPKTDKTMQRRRFIPIWSEGNGAVTTR